MAFEVGGTPLALQQIAGLKAKAEAKPESADATLWRGVKRVLGVILPDPEHALAPEHALKKKPKQDFRGIYRCKFGRYRVFWIASRKVEKVVVLFIGYRKAGDKGDAYADLSRLLRGEAFDAAFEELGVSKPRG